MEVDEQRVDCKSGVEGIFIFPELLTLSDKQPTKSLATSVVKLLAVQPHVECNTLCTLLSANAFFLLKVNVNLVVYFFFIFQEGAQRLI